MAKAVGLPREWFMSGRAALVSKEEGYTLHKGVTGFLERSHVGTILATTQKTECAGTLSGMTITGVYLAENIL